MSDFTHLLDLASSRLGGEALAANDDFFAEKENLVKAEAPISVPGTYTDRGKWMDGWESRRRRPPGHEWRIVKLGLPGIVHALVVDTSFFTGNYPSHCSIEGCGLPQGANALDPGVAWHPSSSGASLPGIRRTRSSSRLRRGGHERSHTCASTSFQMAGLRGCVRWV